MPLSDSELLLNYIALAYFYLISFKFTTSNKILNSFLLCLTFFFTFIGQLITFIQVHIILISKWHSEKLEEATQ